jgi:hypothetical protein
MSSTSRFGRAPARQADSRARPRQAQSLKQPRVDRLQHSVRGRLRGDRAEQRSLAAQHMKVLNAVAAVAEHQGEIAHHPPRVVPRAALPRRGGRPRACGGEADAIGELGQERDAGARDQPPRRHFYRSELRHRLHLRGVLPWSGARASATRILPARENANPRPDQALTGGSGLAAHADCMPECALRTVGYYAHAEAAVGRPTRRDRSRESGSGAVGLRPGGRSVSAVERLPGGRAQLRPFLVRVVKVLVRSVHHSPQPASV